MTFFRTSWSTNRTLGGRNRPRWTRPASIDLHRSTTARFAKIHATRGHEGRRLVGCAGIGWKRRKWARRSRGSKLIAQSFANRTRGTFVRARIRRNDIPAAPRTVIDSAVRNRIHHSSIERRRRGSARWTSTRRYVCGACAFRNRALRTTSTPQCGHFDTATRVTTIFETALRRKWYPSTAIRRQKRDVTIRCAGLGAATRSTLPRFDHARWTALTDGDQSPFGTTATKAVVWKAQLGLFTSIGLMMRTKAARENE